MSIISQTLTTLDQAPAIHFGAITMFPLLGKVVSMPEYTLLEEALRAGTCEVGEVSEGGVVAQLLLDNLGTQLVLLLDGEEVSGAKQNRILNLTVLCQGRVKTMLPVSCVEQGRWRYRTQKFQSAGRTLFSSARAAKMRSVSESMKLDGSRESDQGEVWDYVACNLADFSVSSETGASEEAYEAARSTTEQYLAAMPAHDTQVGAIYAVNGKVMAVEILDSPATYKKVHARLLESFVLDVAHTASIRQPDRIACDDDAQGFLQELATQDFGRYDAIGMGSDLRIESQSLLGAALEFNDRIVHLSAFRAPEPSTSRRRARRQVV